MEDIILTAMAIVVILVVAGSLYSFFRAIFFFIVSGSKDDKRKKGRNSIRFMIIGVLLTLALMLSFPYILKSMNIEVKDSYTVKNVLNKAGELIKKTFELGTMIKKGQENNEYRGLPYYDSSTETSTPASSDQGQPASPYSL